MAMRQRCPLCRNLTRLRNDGTFYKHATVPSSGMSLHTVTNANKCSGSQLSWKHADKIRIDRARNIEWISVKERLPDNLEKIIVRGYSDAYHKEVTLKTTYLIEVGLIDNITHWAPE